MKIIKNKTFQSYLFLITFLMLIEILFRAVSENKIFSLSLIRVFISCSIIALFFGYLTSLFKKSKYTYITNSIILFLFCIYAWLQLGFNSFIGVYMSINVSSQLGAVKDYIKDFIKALSPKFYIMFIPFVLAVILLIVIAIIKHHKPEKFRTLKFKEHNKSINFLSVLASLIILCMAFYVSLEENFSKDSYAVVSNKELFITAENPSLCVKEFGINSYVFVDFKTKFYTVETSSDLYYAMADKKETSRTFDDTAWNTLISEETDEDLNSLNNYFINNNITDTNEYTGMFEGKNLIVIMMESVDDVIYNEEYFPNFSKLANEGWYFKNNYSPRNSCATGNNEFSALTSLYSIYNVCTANVYKDNEYFEAMFNLFNNKGYYSFSAHDFTEGYYYRATIHPNMGSQKYYGVQDLGIDYYTYYGGWASDEDFVNSYLNILDNREDTSSPFMTYLTTVTSHQPYSSSPYGDLYYDMTEGTGYSDTLRRYMSKLKVLDNALGDLIDGLEERDMLDDTVIVLFGDHYPYGLKLNVLNEVLDRSLEDEENEKVPLVIYNSELEGKTFDTYTSYINLLPTLANLFNLDYDPRLYTGTDIFDEDYDNTVVFADSSWKNDKAYYNAETGSITYYTDFTYTDEEIMEINKKIYAKMNASSLAITNNYFKYLNDSLTEIKEREN